MCFSDENKYFIQHNFHSGMRGLSEKEKHERYGMIKLEVRQRLKSSLQGCLNKSKFYHEAFEILSTYELEYLVLNLFYESDFVTIINYLYQSKILDDLSFKDSNSISAKFYSHVISVLKVKKNYNDNDAVYFLKTNLFNLVPIINHNDWRSEDEFNSPVLLKFTQWFFNNLGKENNIDILSQAFFLFVKLWNYFEFIDKAFNRKAILLYTHSISQYDKILDPKELITAYNYLTKLRSMFSTLFVNVRYLPFFDTKNSEAYKQGYLIKRDLFLNRLKESEKLISISESNSILSLFKSIKVSESEIFFLNAKATLKRKIDKHELPTYEEILKIKNMELNGNVNGLRKYLFERLYLFEFL